MKSGDSCNFWGDKIIFLPKNIAIFHVKVTKLMFIFGIFII